jgi:hypothetical protein
MDQYVAARRSVLLGLCGLGAAGPAYALSSETMDVPTARLLATQCHDRTQHTRLIAELAVKLGQIDEAARERIIAAASCPFCGCRLAEE